MHYRKITTAQILFVAMTAVVLCIPGLTHANATFTINNLDGAAEGLNDPGPPDADSTAGGNDGVTLGEQRLKALAYAADLWAGALDSNQEIVVGVKFDPLSCGALTAELGVSGTNTAHRDFAGATFLNTWYPAALANALAGTDLAPGIDDFSSTFNSDIDDNTACSFPKIWYYGLDRNPPAGTIDFVSVALHELAHGLGFQTFVDLGTGAKLNNLDDIFMLWLEDKFTGVLYSNMTNAERVAANTNTGNLVWNGLEVASQSLSLTSGRTVFGKVEMYTPAVLDIGSSVTHFSNSLSPDELMEPSITGAIHDLRLTLALMEDIGWPTNLSSVQSQAALSGGGGGGSSGCFISTLTIW